MSANYDPVVSRARCLSCGKRIIRIAFGLAVLAYISVVIASLAHAQEGTVCANARALDRDTRQLCAIAIFSCRLNPDAMGARTSGQSNAETIRKCVNDAVARGRAETDSDKTLLRCLDDDLSDRDRIVRCSTIIDSSAASTTDRGTAYAYRAMAYASLGMNASDVALYDRAIADANQAIQLTPTLGVGFVARGEAAGSKACELKDMKLLSTAIDDLSHAIRLDPPLYVLHTAFSMRATLYFNAGKYDNAVQDYTEAVKLDRNDAGSLYQRGALEKKLGKVAEGDADIQAAKRIDPQVDK